MVKQKVRSLINDYDPLDLAGDAVWMPAPQGCFGTLIENGYVPELALKAWGFERILDSKGSIITHPDDSRVEKFTLPTGWSTRRHHEWHVKDQTGRGRILIIYDDESGVVGSWLRMPFDAQSRISKEPKIPPSDWWVELCHLGKVVFKSDVVQPYGGEKLQQGEEMEDFYRRLGFDQTTIRSVMDPLDSAALQFLKERFPLFPADPNAYW